MELAPKVAATETRYEAAHRTLLAPEGARAHVEAIAERVRAINDTSRRLKRSAYQGPASAESKRAVLPGAAPLRVPGRPELPGLPGGRGSARARSGQRVARGGGFQLELRPRAPAP